MLKRHIQITRAITFSLFLIMGLLISFGCTKDNEGEKPENGLIPGLGASEEAPEGIQFVLPSGIILPREIQGYTENSCANNENPLGSGSMLELVKLCFTLQNTHDTTITVKIPAGLIFISQNKATQNGFLVKDETIEIPGDSTIIRTIGLYCLNNGRESVKQNETFILGPVTNHGKLIELIKLLEGKKFEVFEYWHEEAIQTAVWNITEREGLTEEDRITLANLTNK